MNALKVTGIQNFMGLDIPVILGGFGEDKKCISDKTIAEIHSQPMPEIRKSISRNIKRFKENVDLIDLAQRSNEITTLDFLFNLGYAKQSITQAEHIYLLSERGYAKLIKIMDTDLAWEVHDKLIDEYFALREEKESHRRLTTEEMLRIELGMIDKQAERMDGVETRVDKLENKMTIDYEQQETIKSLAKNVAINTVGGKNARAYTYQYPPASENDRPPKLYGTVISRLWHDYQDYFCVNSYKNTPAVRFEEALGYVNGWRPPTNMQLEIGKINRGEM